jgi:hypothetical protein
LIADNAGPDNKAKGRHKILQQALDLATGAERWGVTFESGHSLAAYAAPDGGVYISYYTARLIVFARGIDYEREAKAVVRPL